MPLPDERPRQSVANLIGRFETQTKRLSQTLSASSPSRSSSVVSDVTGDSTREEVKEKREWPPKPVAEPEKAYVVLPSLSSRHIPPALITQSSSTGSELGLTNKWKKDTPGPATEEAEVPLTAKALSASQKQAKGEPDSFLENWRKDLPSAQVDMESEPTQTIPAPVQSEASLVTPTLASMQKLGTPAAPRTSNTKATMSRTPASAAAKAPTPASSKTPAKMPLKSTAPKQSLTPLKPQHTGQSVASSGGARKPVAKAPPTPASAKTPSRSEAASRSKTPIARPKTPSTGLFAPTAASLARSRNAPPPVPTPTKKATISSSSMDRLSKPTAASKARIASTPASPASRVPAAKSKVPTSPPKVRKAPSAPQAATGAAVAASVAVIGLATAPAAIDDEHGLIEDVHEAAQMSITSELEASFPVEESTESTEETLAPIEVHSHEVQNEDTQPIEDTESIGSGENEPTPVSPSPAEVEPSAETSEPPALPSVSSDSKDDLEDIVNLLESVSIAKPHEDTIADIPDEILEIPDEDEK